MTIEELISEAARLNADGIIGDQDLADYFECVFAAFDIHLDREAIRHGLWKEYGAADQLLNVRTKADRQRRSLEMLEKMAPDDPRRQALIDNIIEEGYDNINYTIFAIRKLQGKA